VSLRVTKQRAAVLEVLERHPHSDAGFVENAVRTSLGTISKQAVYDVLATLTDTGLVRRVDVGGTAALYELHDGPQHHHAVCRRCAAIFDIDTAGEPRGLALSPSGFVIDEVEVIYRGICCDCRPAATSPPTSNPATNEEY
jgi:Fur family ferric uptake transcriptional regulator